MSIPSGVQVLRITEGVKFSPAGTALRVTNILYMVGEDGPFTLEVEPQNNTQAWIEARLAEKAAAIAALRGAAQ